MILLSESHQGYPTHFFYALGHLAEASDELLQLYPQHAAMVRAERKALEADVNYAPDFDGMIKKIDVECDVCELAGNPRTVTPAPANERKARHNPISWTKCELDYPSIQSKMLSCAQQLEGVPGIESPIAVCRASIKCPP